jgi:hypothetical protein
MTHLPELADSLVTEGVRERLRVSLCRNDKLL